MRARRKGPVAAVERAVFGAPQDSVLGTLFERPRSGERVDLFAEMLDCPIRWSAAARLIALGIDRRFLVGLGAGLNIGQARVLLQSRGRYWEPGGPDARLLLGVFERGALIDICAFAPAQPDQIALRTGHGWALGGERIEAAHRAALADRCFALQLVSDPLAWLRARGRALCVLDWERALPELRSLGERVTIECDAGMGAQVKARLKRGGLPLVSERAPRQEVA